MLLVAISGTRRLTQLGFKADGDCLAAPAPAASAAADQQRAAYPAGATGQLVRAVSAVTSPRAMFECLDPQKLSGVTV